MQTVSVPRQKFIFERPVKIKFYNHVALIGPRCCVILGSKNNYYASCLCCLEIITAQIRL
jgi:hypothetical protein